MMGYSKSIDHKSKVIFHLVIIILFVVIVTACGSEKPEQSSGLRPTEDTVTPPVVEEKPSEPPKVEVEPPKPVKLYIYGGRYVSEEQFMTTYGTHIQSKYPHMSFEVYSNKWAKDVVEPGFPIDIFYADPVAYPRDVAQFNLQYDMSQLIKEFNFDIDKLYSGPIQVIKDTFNMGITGLPLAMRNVVLHYNVDLFEKFGVDPPRDGITWDELYDLARAMTRNDGGIQYRGFDFSTHLIDYNQLSLGTVDPKTGKASVNNDEWGQLVENFTRFFRIPGNEVTKTADAMNWTRFGTDGITAMNATTFMSAATTKDIFNMDYAVLPSFGSRPGVGSQSPATYIGITASTKNPKEAFQMIEYLLSEEFQMISSRSGSIPSLKNKEINDAFGADIPELQGKNLKAVIPSNPAPPAPLSQWAGSVQANLWTPLLEVFTLQVDLNTGLRNIEESINNKIEELKVIQ